MAKRMGERVKGVTLRFIRSPSFDKYWVIVALVLSLYCIQVMETYRETDRER